MAEEPFVISRVKRFVGGVAIAYGVAADIASPAERGGYVGILSFG